MAENELTPEQEARVEEMRKWRREIWEPWKAWRDEWMRLERQGVRPELRPPEPPSPF